jgi:hypothetical protein
MLDDIAAKMAATEGWMWQDNRQMLDCAAAGHQNTSRERDTWRNRARVVVEACAAELEALVERRNAEGRPKAASGYVLSSAAYLRHAILSEQEKPE